MFHYSLTTLRSAAKERRVSDADFSVGNGSLFRRLQRAADVNHGAFQMTFTGPFVSKLSVVAAYVAFAFVGAIVFGVF